MSTSTRRATLQQIAEEVGISVSTVSRALNNRAQIDASTRTRVQAVAERLGYRTNRIEEPRERGLALAVIMSASTQLNEAQTSRLDYNESDHIQRMLFTIQQVAQERDYHIVLNTDTGIPGVLPSSVRTHFVDGALLVGGQFSDAMVEAIAREVPTVFVASYLPSGRVHAIHADYRHGVLQAMHYLVELGHKRIGFVNGPNDTNTSSEKLAGYLQGCFEHQLPINHESIVNAENFNVNAGAAAAEALFARGEWTAVVAASDVLARGVLQYAQQHTIAVPEQISIVSLYNDAEDVHYQERVQLTHVRPLHSLLAQLAVDQLVALIKEPNLSPVNTVVPIELVLGASSGRAPT